MDFTWQDFFHLLAYSSSTLGKISFQVRYRSHSVLWLTLQRILWRMTVFKAKYSYTIHSCHSSVTTQMSFDLLLFPTPPLPFSLPETCQLGKRKQFCESTLRRQTKVCRFLLLLLLPAPLMLSINWMPQPPPPPLHSRPLGSCRRRRRRCHCRNWPRRGR